MARDDDAIERAARLAGEAVGELMEFWNFKPSMGRVWTALYLSREPLTAAEIVRRTGLSTGSVSMTLAELQRWGVVRRVAVPGARSRHFEAETDVVAMVGRVLRERELRLVDEAIARFEEALRIVDEEGGSSRPAAMLRARFVATRIGALLHLARRGRALVETLARVGRVDLREIRGVLAAARPGRGAGASRA